jgi:hypothetical protein
MSQRKVYGKVDTLKSGRTIVYVLSRRSSIVTCVDVKEQTDQSTRDNTRISMDETASEINLNHGNNRFKSGSNLSF